MNKKEFYEAPEWGLRMVTVERQYLQDTFSNGGIQSIEGDNVESDSDNWS